MEMAATSREENLWSSSFAVTDKENQGCVFQFEMIYGKFIIRYNSIQNFVPAEVT